MASIVGVPADRSETQPSLRWLLPVFIVVGLWSEQTDTTHSSVVLDAMPIENCALDDAAMPVAVCPVVQKMIALGWNDSDETTLVAPFVVGAVIVPWATSTS